MNNETGEYQREHAQEAEILAYAEQVERREHEEQFERDDGLFLKFFHMALKFDH